jgi:hypothetical protein
MCFIRQPLGIFFLEMVFTNFVKTS